MSLKYGEDTKMRTPSKEPLTPRQLEIAQWTACGLTDKEIAGRMHVSTSTITNTKRNVNEKYGFNNSCELVAFYFAAYHSVSTDFDLVGKIKRVISSIALLMLMAIEIIAADSNAQRVRRSCRPRRNEYEIEVNKYL